MRASAARALVLLVPLVASRSAIAKPAAPASASSPLWTEGRAPSASNAPVTQQSFVRLARTLGPAVVNISTVQPIDREAPGPRMNARGLGTGFVIHKSGLILTNQHVIGHAERIRVRLADEREFAARLVGGDERTDLALLHIDADDLSVAPLGDSDRLEIGEWVIAIGNPFGLDHTVTAGIVSAKGRRDVHPDGAANGFYDFIQTDASINAGNSGGPLINSRGEVIGINTAMKSEGQGIAFAIPINIAKAIVPQLHAKGRAARAWLGIHPQPVTQTLERAFSLPDRRGALVAEVVAGSPAAVAGIEVGDVVRSFDGKPISRADDLSWLVATTPPARKVALAIVHAGAERSVDVTLAAALDEAPPLPRPPLPTGHASALGITVSEITAEIARELQQPDLRGVVVMGVEAESPADEAGVEKGDVVLRVGDEPVEAIDDYARAVRAVPKGAMIRLLVRRTEHGPSGAADRGRALWLAFSKR